MKDVNRWVTVLALASLSGIFTGCSDSRKGQEDAELVTAITGQPAEVEEPEVVVDEAKIVDLIHTVDGLYKSARTNEANQVFFDALENKELLPAAEQISRLMIRFLLFSEQVEVAQEKFLALLRTAPDQVMASNDLIYGYLLETGKQEEALDWARVLLAQDLPMEMRTTAAGWVLDGVLSSNPEGVSELVDQLLKEFDAETICPILQRSVLAALSGKKTEIAEKMVAQMKAAASDKSPAIGNAVALLEIRIAAAKGDFGAIEKALPGIVGKVQDPSIFQALSFVYRNAREQKSLDALERISGMVVSDPLYKDLKNTRNSAAREWCNVLFLRDDETLKAAYPERLDKLLALGFSPKVVLGIYSRHFYQTIESKPLLQACADVSKRLEPLLKEEADLSLLRTFRLDTAFMLDDYEEALRLLEAGIPDHDEAWHKLSIVKVKAHIALREKKYDEAAALFREFISLLPEEEQFDPQTGVGYTRDILAAKNEVRIGDFMTEAGRAEEAKAAYDKANELYAKCLADEKLVSDARRKGFLEESVKALEKKLAPPASEPAEKEPVEPAAAVQ
ncbi:MAG: hypothetical protein ACI4QT_08095 [Kiritimatiellia bacterium]